MAATQNLTVQQYYKLSEKERKNAPTKLDVQRNKQGILFPLGDGRNCDNERW